MRETGEKDAIRSSKLMVRSSKNLDFGLDSSVFVDAVLDYKT